MALDPSYFFYSEGTISLTNGSDIATGEFTAWDPAVLPFDFVYPNDGTAGMSVIKEVLAMDEIRLAKPWTGPTLTDAPYFMVRWTRHTDPRIYALRVSDYLTRLKGIPENIGEYADQISADAAAVAAAMTALAQIEVNVDADRQAAQTASGAAQTARTGAETALSNLRSVFYGAYAADPTTRPDGSARQEGDTYTRTTAPKGLRVFLDDAWTAAAVETNGALLKVNSLSDLPDKAAARTNLGLLWRPLRSIVVTTPVSAIDITIPTDINHLRFEGELFVSTDAAFIGGLVSRDGGTTFVNGTNDYWQSRLVMGGSPPGVSFVSTAPNSVMRVTLESVNTVTPALLTGSFFKGGAALRSMIRCQSTVVTNTMGQQISTISNYAAVNGTANVLRLFASSGDIAVGSRLVVEGM